MGAFSVYEVRFGEGPTTHHGIFLQTSEDGSGTLFDVRGSVGAGGGLVFKSSPERLCRFDYTAARGAISKQDVPKLETICGNVPAPGSQYPASGGTGLAVPNCRCIEWNAEAWMAIESSGILRA
ncbi:hypothetical protein UVI_02028100 [Ustilaginoidea virens]|uniref:Uncharacterized protein n=1 Tax=Ustilaginoidea virens TaxID=1159556 RepID=A0A1B5KVG7_USTVR|nr:hypothetical protein UVI_02028100 [Ustilaginoidea virens]